MSYQFFTCLAVAALLSLPHSLAAAEPLAPAFVDESRRDPFLTPAAQISGPLNGERLDESWDRRHFADPYNSLHEPVDVFQEADDSCTGATSLTAAPRRAIMDSGVTYTWMASVDDFGVSDVDIKTQLVIPIFIKGSPLRVAMTAGTTFLQTPATIDVPEQLYGLQAELRWFVPLRAAWAVDLAAGVGLFSDLSGSGSNGFRVTGRAILVKEVDSQWKLSVGFLYLGRENLQAVPVAGAIYSPSDDKRIELVLPRSRVLKRISFSGTREHWIYAGMELFGGNSWAIEQSTGDEDVFIYKDNRVIAGYETKATGGLNGRVEVGYVFTRKVEFENDPATLDPGGTVLLRAGLVY